MMNVKFNENDAKDVARRLKVDYSTVTGWCRRGLINFIDVSSNKSNSARYQIPEEEVVYLESLFKKWGVRKGILHYDKTRLNKELETVSEPVEKPFSLSDLPANWMVDEENETSTSMAEGVLDEQNSRRFNAEKLTNTILRIYDIKDRLEDLDAEKNQLTNELNMLKKELQDAIDL